MEGTKIHSAYELVSEKVYGWIEALIKMLPNMAVAVVVLLLFYFVAKGVKRFAGKILQKQFSNKGLINLILNIIYMGIITVGLFTALEILELDKTVTSLLAGIGVIGLALGFAFQDTAANFVSGLFLAVRSPIEIGDIIESGEVKGIVQEINLRSTLVRTFQGTDVVIPNKDVFQRPLYNLSNSGKRRIDLSCGISYGDDLDKVKKITTEAILNTEGILPNDGVNFFFNEFGSSSINFVVTAWSAKTDQKGYLEAQSNMIVALKKAFDANDIMIPFPIRTLDFGIKGGEKLKEMLEK